MFKNLPEELRRKLFWGVSSLGYLALAYRLITYNFFHLHGMKDWPNTLAIVSAFVIIVVSLLDMRIPAIATVIAYVSGFGLAMLFNSDSLDPGGARTNNAWIIWIGVYVVIVLGGFVINFIIHKKEEVE